MLIYRSEELSFNPKNYNATYSRDRARFEHDHTYQAIDWVFGEFLTTAGCRGCIDIGCGQGQVLEYVFGKAVEFEMKPDGGNFFGIDISDVAIGQCQARCPHLGWIIDTYQGFLQSPLARETDRGKIDLVVNKGGLTHVRGHWNHIRCGRWDLDIFDLMREVFGNIRVLHHSGYYICAMGPGVPAEDGDREPGRSRPRRIEFRFRDGSTAVRRGRLPAAERPSRRRGHLSECRRASGGSAGTVREARYP